ncbi:hypothetical protein ACIGMX_04415 [Streptomyces aquilus]|uniref:Uncharacterized protein n=1 Tax=Streptomyces aquilus TaxID=2548456 RepID=A0A3Q9C730_9ACTN|nr:hypothetical protein [Streptomyces aquilus]AZP22320.1 hypothetical protein EJC51_43275 [Streptomyces aquilus]
MITAWSLLCVPRVRVAAGPLLRVSALAVLLFGIVFTHGLHAESAEGHLVTGVTESAAATVAANVGVADEQSVSRSAAIGEPREGHGSSHPNEHCVSGQPQQGPVLTPPFFAVSVGESTVSGTHLAQRAFGGPVLAVVPSAARGSTVVQQV